jgi:hypothetical protein
MLQPFTFDMHDKIDHRMTRQQSKAEHEQTSRRRRLFLYCSEAIIYLLRIYLAQPSRARAAS